LYNGTFEFSISPLAPYILSHISSKLILLL
jgi:hypothetical protein